MESRMSDIDKIERLISEGRLTFQHPKFRENLLGNSVSADLLALVVHLCSLESKIEISSVIRPARGHPQGQAVDIGNEKVARTLLPRLATDAEVKRLKIDQIIFDARQASADNEPNRWNYNGGRKATYGAGDLQDHRNHIHLAVMSSMV